MKNLLTLLFVFSISLVFGQGLNGAWVSEEDGIKEVLIITDGFFSISTFKQKEFIETEGGKLMLSEGKMKFAFEYHTEQPEFVGTEMEMDYSVNGDILEADFVTWKRLDNGSPGKLAGTWLFSGRERDGKMSRRDTDRPRKTMKILSGTRFQWIAYNTETMEFMGTGGGTYTTVDGKYTENIDFFSRDNNRVGASLEFNFELKDGEWHHKGFSSKGDPMYEVWSPRSK